MKLYFLAAVHILVLTSCERSDKDASLNEDPFNPFGVEDPLTEGENLFGVAPPFTGVEEGAEGGDRSGAFRTPDSLEFEKFRSELHRVQAGKPAGDLIALVVDGYEAIDSSNPAETESAILRDFSSLFPYGAPDSRVEESFADKKIPIDHRLSGGQSQTKLYGLTALAVAELKAFQALLIERSREKPSRGDLAIYYSTLMSVSLFSEELKEMDYEPLLELKNSENPIYRAVIALMIISFEHDEKNRLKYFESFLPEDNPVVAGILIRNLADIGGDDAKRAINSLTNSLPRERNSEFYRKIDAILEND